jgi:predicted O-methyltransferase YrrM
MNINKNALKRIILKIHRLGIKFGIHIFPTHYYTSVPNILELERTLDIWAKKSELPGVSVNLDEQVNNLRNICMPYQSEYSANRFYQEGMSNHFGLGYGYIEAQALHAVIRRYKPKQIVEVGSGVSTYCMLKASEMNSQKTLQCAKITSIEPYPSEKLKSLSQIRLIPNQVQTVSLAIFTELAQGDFLFIDSSHTVKAGGDVNYLILEVLPRLQRGVIVHFHDIFLPYDYQPDVLQTLFHWAETSLLRAFLIFNNKTRIIFCLSHLHYERKDVLREVFPEYNPQDDINGLRPEKYKPFDPIPEHFPSSIYIEML